MSPRRVILTGGTVRTMDPGASAASGVVIAGGRIEGLLAHGQPLPDGEVIDVGGGCILPGFTDSHVHFPSWAVSRRELDLRGATSAADAARRARAAARALRGDGWLRGRGWREGEWADEPHRDLLGGIDRPVALRAQDGHSLWLNAAALAAAGDEHATGILRETAAWDFQRAHFEPTLEEKVAAVREALPVAAARGVTAIHDFDGHRGAPEVFGALRDALTLRVHQTLPIERVRELSPAGPSPARDVGDVTVKAFMDGTLGSSTALLIGGGGEELLTGEGLAEVIREAAAHGCPVAVHAIGDLANRHALDAFESTRDTWAPLGLRPRIEHAQCVHPDDQGRFARLGVTASMQFSHGPSDRPIAERLWGDRLGHAYPCAALHAAGARIADGSDAPVEDLDPLAGLRAGVAQGVPLGAALAAITTVPAWLEGAETERGRIAPGLAADIVVLDRDPAQDLAGARVRMTVFGGQRTA